MSGAEPAAPYLRVNNLSVRFRTEGGMVHAVDEVSFTVAPSETVGIVGESGSGKTAIGLAILGLHDPRHTEISGEILVAERNIVGATDLRSMRGRDISIIFQDPQSALHPYYTIGRQISEAYRAHHRGASRAQTRQRAIEMLDRVGIAEPHKRVDQYPHEFSGGMRQRALIAMSLVNDPRLLIADEPTTALDVTVQAGILDLLVDLRREFHSAIILITHDFGVVSSVADRVLVMYAGRVVECGSVEQLLRRPEHPYSWGLLACVPVLHGPAGADLVPIGGDPPSLITPPPGCAFHPRCRFADRNAGRCATEVPIPAPSADPGHMVACHLPTAVRTSLSARRSAGPGSIG